MHYPLTDAYDPIEPAVAVPLTRENVDETSALAFNLLFSISSSVRGPPGQPRIPVRR